jgi:predicted DNA-binding ribbon-helix-helix protein
MFCTFIFSPQDNIELTSNDIFHCPSASDEDSEPSLCDISGMPIHKTDMKNIELYHTGLAVKKSIADQSDWNINWPPTSEVISQEECAKLVPVELFNLLALVTNATEEVPPSDTFVEVTDEARAKLVSICMDIIYLSSNGRIQTPKSLALGLTLRHLTGSTTISNLLHKFGHCASYDSVVRYETGLAIQRMETNKTVPKGFRPGVFTVAVWDNIDMDEETGSGSGTTHHTNGILVQPSVSEYEQQATSLNINRSQRTLQVEPVHIDHYRLTSREGPQDLSPEISIGTSTIKTNRIVADQRKDFGFIMIKYLNQTTHLLPGWTGYNQLLQHHSILQKSAIHYLPVIEASPTEYSTVNMILTNSVKLANQLQLESMVVVFDQAIYAKAQIIRWKDPVLTSKLVIRLGEFHTMMSYLGILGKRFGIAGFQDIVVEAGIVAVGSINGVLSGKHYNRAMRAHKLMFEALERLRFKAFVDSLAEEEGECVTSLIKRLQDSFHSQTDFADVLGSECVDELAVKYDSFITHESENRPSFALWSSYLSMVGNLLSFLRATRTSDWLLHLDAVRLMIPWFFAYDRINYSR